MPRTEPHGIELLQLARRTLLEEIVPAAPEAQRYVLRMVANAIAIAAREIEAEATGTAPDRSSDAALADDIRSGRAALDGEFLARLREDVGRRLALSNPRALERKST
jgi:hypothetical protein